MAETRYQRVAREQAERQARQAETLANLGRAVRRLRRARVAYEGRKPQHEETYEDRLDDIGESPD